MIIGKYTRLILLVVGSYFGLVETLNAANCPDGKPEVVIDIPEVTVMYNKIGGTYYYTGYANVTATLNCDVDPCKTKIGGDIIVYSNYPDNDSERPGEEYPMGSGGEGSGVATGTCNLCDKGNETTFMIQYESDGCTEPTYADATGFVR